MALRFRMAKHHMPFILDWIIGLLALGTAFSLELAHPVERIVIIDETIQYPYIPHDTIPAYYLLLIGVVAPAILSYLFLRYYFKARRYQIHITILGLVLAVGFTYLFTNIIKLSAGRLRPDFLSRCHPAQNTTVFSCTGNAKLVREGRKSFPSGHTSYSFAGMGYLSLVLLGHFTIPSLAGRSLKILVVSLPLLLASFIGLSRIFDYRHHWQDVLGGAVLGLSVAYVTYRQYFPNPVSEHSYLLLRRGPAMAPGAISSASLDLEPGLHGPFSPGGEQDKARIHLSRLDASSA